MMTQTTINYAKVLFDLGISEEAIRDADRIFGEVPELCTVLKDPVIPKSAKQSIIERVFPGEIKNFLKVVSDYQKMEIVRDIFATYFERKDEMNGIVRARLSYVVPPTKEQLDKMETFVCGKYHAKGVKWDMEKDPKMIGGFILHVNGREYDYSIQGRLKRLEQKLTWR